jgi:hypothetical protein
LQDPERKTIDFADVYARVANCAVVAAAHDFAVYPAEAERPRSMMVPGTSMRSITRSPACSTGSYAPSRMDSPGRARRKQKAHEP